MQTGTRHASRLAVAETANRQAWVRLLGLQVAGTSWSGALRPA